MLSQLRRSALSVARRSIVPSVAPPRVLSALIIPARAFTQGLAPAYFDRGDRPERPARFSRDNDSRGPGRQFGERTQETNTVFLSPFPVKSTKEDIQQFLRENGITDFKHIDITSKERHASAYVMFPTSERTQECISALGGLEYDGREIRAQQSHAMLVAPSRHVFCFNIPSDFTESDFKEVLEDLDINNVQSLSFKNGFKGPSAILSFETVEIAEKVLAVLREGQVGDQKLGARFALEPAAPTIGEPSSNVFLANFHHDVTEAEIRDALEPFTGLHSVRFVQKTNRPVAIAQFKSVEDATACLDALVAKQVKRPNGETLGESLRISYGRKDPRTQSDARSPIKSPRLYVGGLGEYFETADVEALFKRIPGYQSIHIPRDRETDSPKGFAYVTYESEEAAEQAIDQLAGETLGAGRPLRLDYAHSEQKSFDRRAPRSFDRSGPPRSFDRGGSSDRRPSFGRPSFGGRDSGDRRPSFDRREPSERRDSFGGGFKRESFGQREPFGSRPQGGRSWDSGNQREQRSNWKARDGF